MTHIIAMLAALTCALSLTGAALAAPDGSPFRFTDRAGSERVLAKLFVAIGKRDLHKHYVVKSIGCAKGGLGRAVCGVTAIGPVGVGMFVLSLSCPTDALTKACTYRVDPVTTS